MDPLNENIEDRYGSAKPCAHKKRLAPDRIEAFLFCRNLIISIGELERSPGPASYQ